MRLSVPLRQKLHAALLAAFSDYEALDLAFQLYLGSGLPAIAPLGAMPIVIMKTIVWAESHGRLPELIDAARQARPQNPDLLSFSLDAQSEMAAARHAPAALTAAGATPPRPQLERVVLKSVEFANVEKWRADMIACERAVSRIEFPVNQGQATGFLVGADLLITNYHVLEPFISGTQPWSLVAARFGYRADAKGTTVHGGHDYALATTPLVASSEDDDLDYAIVRLAQPAGNEPPDEADKNALRGWLRPLAHAFEAAEPIFIVQHPRAYPLRVTTGAYVDGDAKRVRYQANTLPGSSGSPCFTAGWGLVALHAGALTTTNTGVPMAAIVADLANKGLPSLLGSAGT